MADTLVLSVVILLWMPDPEWKSFLNTAPTAARRWTEVLKMREILFRGKLRADGRWAEGNLAVSKDGVCIITPDDTPLGCYGQVDPDTVGQYTGMTDKNGKKIFEGDIHEINGSHFVVEYGAFYDCENDVDLYGFYLKDIDFQNRTYSLEGNESEYFNICDNIHDNPELLKNRSE